MRSTGLMRAGHSSACCKTCSHTPEGLLKERALPACVHSMNGQKHGLTDKRTASTHMPTEQAVMKERRHLEAEGKGKKHVTSFPEWKLKAEQWWEQGQVHQACLLPADLLHRALASPPFWLSQTLRRMGPTTGLQATSAQWLISSHHNNYFSFPPSSSSRLQRIPYDCLACSSH